MSRDTLHEIREILQIQAELLGRLSELLSRLETPGNGGEEERAYSMREAANKLGVSISTLHRLVMRGEIKAARIGGRKVIPASEIRRLLGA